MQNALKELKTKKRDLDARMHEAEADLAYAQRAMDAIKFIRDLHPAILERPSTTFAHHLRDALRKNDFVNVQRERGKSEGADYESQIFAQAKYFLVQHDWAAAFRGAGDYDEGEFHLPFEICVFEFKISGCRVVVAAFENEDGIKITPIIETPAGWTIIGYVFNLEMKPEEERTKEPAFNLLRMLVEQLRAVCIALDAEVADTVLTETPPKLNRAREKSRKAPISDHHVIYLSHRHHGHGTGEGIGTKRRLHFRRGHWRHYEERRTWIRWTLVGNPDLGFVDKQYRL